MFPKIGAKPPKLDGENNGKPDFLMDDLGVPPFLETPFFVMPNPIPNGRFASRGKYHAPSSFQKFAQTVKYMKTVNILGVSLNGGTVPPFHTTSQDHF